MVSSYFYVTVKGQTQRQVYRDISRNKKNEKGKKTSDRKEYVVSVRHPIAWGFSDDSILQTIFLVAIHV